MLASVDQIRWRVEIQRPHWLACYLQWADAQHQRRGGGGVQSAGGGSLQEYKGTSLAETAEPFQGLGETFTKNSSRMPVAAMVALERWLQGTLTSSSEQGELVQSHADAAGRSI